MAQPEPLPDSVEVAQGAGPRSGFRSDREPGRRPLLYRFQTALGLAMGAWPPCFELILEGVF